MREEIVAGHLLSAVRALRDAEEELRPDTEYLRDELKELLHDVGILFEKIHTEHVLLEAKEVLHGEREQSRNGERLPESGGGSDLGACGETQQGEVGSRGAETRGSESQER